MATEPSRRHYRADSPEAVAAALLALVRLARTGTDDFTFGPTVLADAERDGITVTGPDLFAAVGVLAAITGLAEYDSTTNR